MGEAVNQYVSQYRVEWVDWQERKAVGIEAHDLSVIAHLVRLGAK